MAEKEYKVFDTVINGKVTEVWNRPESHGLGSMNGQEYCDHWYAAVVHEVGAGESGITWVPWTDIGANRVCFELNVVQGNYTKTKWDETSIRGTGHIDIMLNKRKVYEIPFNGLNWAIAKAQVLMTEMLEHPFNFVDPESEIGRKVWYKNQPAIISRLVLDQGCVIFKKEDGSGFDMTNPWDRKEDWDVSEWDGENEVKDDIFAEGIWWFRD